jgi:hypothetical protein
MHVSPFFHPTLSKHTELGHLQTQLVARANELERMRLLFLASLVVVPQTIQLPIVVSLLIHNQHQQQQQQHAQQDLLEQQQRQDQLLLQAQQQELLSQQSSSSIMETNRPTTSITTVSDLSPESLLKRRRAASDDVQSSAFTSPTLVVDPYAAILYQPPPPPAHEISVGVSLASLQLAFHSLLERVLRMERTLQHMPNAIGVRSLSSTPPTRANSLDDDIATLDDNTDLWSLPYALHNDFFDIDAEE